MKFEYQESKTEANWDEMQNLQRKIDRAEHAQRPYPILESLQPRYREHRIEGWEGNEEIEIEQTNETEPDYVEPEPEEKKEELEFWSHGDKVEEEEVKEEPEEEKEEMGFW